MVHPARRRRTHSITVTVRSAYSMASSRTSESDSLPVSSACKAQRWYESQSRRLNDEVPSAVPVSIQNCFLRPCTVSAPPPPPPLPFNIPKSAPVHVDLDCHWLNNLEEFSIFLLVAPPCKRSYVRPCIATVEHVTIFFLSPSICTATIHCCFHAAMIVTGWPTSRNHSDKWPTLWKIAQSF